MGNIILAYFNTIERSLRSNNSFEKKKKQLIPKKIKSSKILHPSSFSIEPFRITFINMSFT